jgi:ABC-type sulfate transport system permease component
VTSLPQDVAVLVTAAVVAVPTAWLLVRDAEPHRPSPARENLTDMPVCTPFSACSSS